MKNDCLFCKIIKGEIPSYTIYEDDKVKVFLDINPTSNGHLLVIPKMHYKDITDIESDYLTYIFDLVKKLLPDLEKKLKFDGVSLCQNNGIAQEVKHFHLHVIPKYKTSYKLSVEEVYNIIKIH